MAENTVSIARLINGRYAVRVMFTGGAATAHVSREELEKALALAPGRRYTQPAALAHTPREDTHD